MNGAREPIALLAAWALLAAFSAALGPKHGYGIWLLEVGPALLALAVLIPTHGRFRFTPLLYRLIFFHACVLTLGAHYTYAEVPLGFWLQDAFGLARNHYDRFGHLVQGFVPALVAREVLLRKSPLVRGKWLFFLVLCVCLAVAALYELIEWWTALAAGGSQVGEDFLGTQGDPWDAQWDMFLCLLGALAALVTLSGLHDRQLSRLADGNASQVDDSSPAGDGERGA
jgi:putative membrane protein